MAAKDITTFFFYRWRYIVGYSAIGILLAGLLIFACLFVPGGLSTEETASVVRSASLSFSDPATLGVTNLPYHLIQALSMNLFGVNNFSIKIPSLIIALLSATGLILLLRRWFKPNIAVLASLIAVTTGQFLFIAQSGTPGIMYVFWPILLLTLGTQVTRAKKGKLLWKLLFAATTALSLYTPLSIYTLIAITLAVALHPHLRNIIRRLATVQVAVSASLVALLIAPLIYLIVINPSLSLYLLGVPAVWPPDLAANALVLLRQFFLFWEPSTTTLMTPVFGLGSILIIGLGVYRMIITRDTTRSYLIIIWVLCLIPVLLLNPLFTSVTFVPSVLLLAAGLTSLITYWYRLFPLNPYARIAGLIPIIVLVVALIGSGLDRYIYGYHYAPSTAVNFSQDLRLLPKDTTLLVVAESELPFYSAVAKHRAGLIVTTLVTTEPESLIATRAARPAIPEDYMISRIITTTDSDESDRLYIYKKVQQ
jgi:4-amino-4-deoxy-L-arabinose transferase-like glycosyltransferase